MALAGVHITFSDTAQGLAQSGELLPYRVTGSQTMASAATSSIKAIGHGNAQVLLRINASAAIFYATGPSPDPNGTRRCYMDPAFGREDVFVDDGDLFAWVLA